MTGQQQQEARRSKGRQNPHRNEFQEATARRARLVSKDNIYSAPCFSRIRLFVTPWTVARRAPLSMGFSRQAYWSGWPFPSPGDLPDPGIEPAAPELQADSLPLSHQGNPRLFIESSYSHIPSPLPPQQSSVWECFSFTEIL